MEEDEGVVWENYLLFPLFFTLSLPIAKIFVVYKTRLSDTHKEMLTKISEIFIVFDTTITLQVWTGH